MSSTDLPEWETYACGRPKKSNKSCQELTEVHHVVHVPEARRILEDGRIKAGLVYDKSRLQSSRMCVTWLSANTWGKGSIYGNVQFTFDWHSIVKKRHVYWVEAMTTYHPSAYRLLLTDRNITGSDHVKAYNSKTDNGPLKRKRGMWYWNGEYTSEFMIEEDLSLDMCTKMQFINHHDQLCQSNGSSCPYLGAVPYKISATVMAFILGNSIHNADSALFPNGKDRSQIDFSISNIYMKLGWDPKSFIGGIKKSGSRQAVLRGALALYGSGQNMAAKKLVSLLANESIFKKALREIVAKHFDWPDYRILD